MNDYEIQWVEYYLRYLDIEIRTNKLLLEEAETRHNPYHDPVTGRFTTAPKGKSKSKALTKQKNNVRLDSRGKPFKFSTVNLPPKEYANVMSDIGRRWNTCYKGKELCRLEFTDKTYYFENHGIGDYNVYKVKSNE